MSVLTPAPSWRLIQGHVYGLAQPSLLGTIGVALPAGTHLKALDRFMATLVAEPAPRLTEADPGLALIERVVHWVGEIQRQARIALSTTAHIRPLPTGQQRAFEIAMPVATGQACTAALKFVVKAVNRCLEAPLDASDSDALRAEFAQLADELKPHADPGFNRFHVLQAAFRLGVPVSLLAGRAYRFGVGIRARVMESSITDTTSALGMKLAQDKWITARVLRALGLPVPTHERVGNAEQAVAAARALGYPVVVKPANLDQGRGVAANLRSDAAVVAAFDTARALSEHILVEKHFDGFGHRLTVHDGELIGALRRIPGGVVGDGEHSIRQLVEIQLQQPDVRRSVNMGRVRLDDEAGAMLAEQGLELQSVPAAGRFVVMRRRDNLSAGGTLEHIDPARIHPDNLQLALRAARALYLDLAGVDILSADISQSWRTAGAVICEVNGRPQFGPGPKGDNFERVLRRMLGPDARIPVHLYLCGSQEAADLPERLQALQRQLGVQAVSCSHGVWVDGQSRGLALTGGFAAARAALFDRDTTSLLMALTPREVMAQGLPIDCVDAVHVAKPDNWPREERQELEHAIDWAGSDATQVHFEASPR
ncbi:MAG: acetate--CoA ligase family protein [Rubrivivax sp.]|nr:acetate--CoA ligase family protein [Rubrivivax sp.]